MLEKSQPHKLRSILSNSLLLITTFVMGVFIIEVGVRAFYPQKDHFYRPHSTRGTELIPNKSGRNATEGNAIPIAINAFGFRGWNATLEKPPQTFRIAVIGDSYVEALQVAESDMFTNQLKDLLQHLEPDGWNYEVLAFGVSGYGTAQEFLLLEEVKRFRPDLVLLAFTSANDVRNNVFALEQEQQKPYFSLENNQLSFRAPIITNSITRKINFFLLDHSHFYRLLIQRGSAALFRVKTQATQITPLDFFIFQCQETSEWKTAWDVTLALIEKMATELQKDNIPFVLVHVESYFQVLGEQGLQQLIKQYPSMQGQCWDVEKPDSTLKEFAQEKNLLFLDLLPAFRKAYEQSGESGHLLKDGHWNESGHVSAADAIFDFLIEKNLIP